MVSDQIGRMDNNNTMSFFNLRACTLTQEHVEHEHAYHQLIVATSGVTELEIEGRGERITRHRGCLIPSTYHHAYIGDGCNRTLVLNIPLGNRARTSCGEEINRLFERPRFFNVTPELHQLAQGLIPQVDCHPTLHSEIATLILRAIHLTLYDKELSYDKELCQAQVYPRRAVIAKQRERLDMRCIDGYVDANLSQRINVEDLAALCALSPGYFHARFRQVQGVTPQVYVMQRRLSHAKFLLEHTSLALGRIAEQVGFLDQGSFSRAYRRLYAVTPSFHRHRAGSIS